MNINKVKVYIMCLMLTSVQIVSASGFMYNIEEIDESQILIELRRRDEETSEGIRINHFYLVNGKTLHIGYETGEELPEKAHLEYNLINAIPPIKVRLENINNRDWLPFSDIKGIEAKEYILHLYDAGIVNGRADGTFSPDSFITRAEFMVLLVNSLNLEGEKKDINMFSDISEHWAKEIILIAAENNFISGYQDNTIRPDRPITLAEVSSIISRAFNFKTTKNGMYSKLRRDKWYSDSVKKMFDCGIIKVDDEIYDDFNEESFITRSNCAMMVSRALSTY
ncbi:S-layer homology domain-containing protein [Herbivorax sp. ANBcel31]|uniref:S-layer homology domain-containing protein n=1 Tax=Herbivorax sp. ANBcel31 TaxID=3069754 RepID=UPI0027B45B48|nr:S-layer homology domain-containing protein [Herbivorax sp. ANBcel31]MDQ2087865.1 S-layer homology domain-containing protein [Herbivorax sp. ANBcel31]